MSMNTGVFDARGDGLVIDAVTDLEHGARLITEFSKTGAEILCENTGEVLTPWLPARVVSRLVEELNRG